MSSQPQRESLPFEPKSNKRQGDKAVPLGSASPTKKAGADSQTTSEQKSGPAEQAADSSIPEAVSRRMIRRMAIFAGVPTTFGMMSFVIAYVLLTRHIVELPNIAVLLVSLGFFGLGTVGLSYGVLSASWQEDVEGSLLGIDEFSVNFRRLVKGLRKSKQPSASE